MRTLLRMNALAGLLAVSLAAVLAYPLYNDFFLVPAISRHVIESARSEAERTAAHLAEPFFDAAGLIRQEQVTPAFRDTMARHLRAFQLEKLKVFAPSGEIVFATEPAEEGMVNAKRYFREVVSTGRTRTNVVRRNGRTAEGRIEEFDVVETYLPVVRGGRVVGVLEIYYDITARTGALNRLLARSSRAILLGAGGFLAALVCAVLSALRLVRKSEHVTATLREERDRFAAELRGEPDRPEQTTAGGAAAGRR